MFFFPYCFNVRVFMHIFPLAQLLKNQNPTDPVSLLKSFTPLTFRSLWWASPNNPPSHPNPTVFHRQIVHHRPLHPSSDLHHLCCSAHISHHHHSRVCPRLCRHLVDLLFICPLHLFCPPTQTSAPSLFFFSLLPHFALPSPR